MCTRFRVDSCAARNSQLRLPTRVAPNHLGKRIKLAKNGLSNEILTRLVRLVRIPGDHLPQHVGQKTTVLVILSLDRGIYPA